jgi:hypothetical protein
MEMKYINQNFVNKIKRLRSWDFYLYYPMVKPLKHSLTCKKQLTTKPIKALCELSFLIKLLSTNLEASTNCLALKSHPLTIFKSSTNFPF